MKITNNRTNNFGKIIIAENTNLRTKNKTDAQMVKDIKKWIEEEVKCYSNQ